MKKARINRKELKLLKKIGQGGRKPNASGIPLGLDDLRCRNWQFPPSSITFENLMEDWAGRELNPRHRDFQSLALPTELPAHDQNAGEGDIIEVTLTRSQKLSNP